VTALVCSGYPLCGGGDPSKLRDQILRAIRTPILFVQGTRDPLCPLSLAGIGSREMSAPNEVHVVEGGDHSLRVTKSELKAGGKTQDDVNREILGRIEGFVERHSSAGRA
jgi:predicted alpha/beta-hydrolase family hydrolase